MSHVIFTYVSQNELRKSSPPLTHPSIYVFFSPPPPPPLFWVFSLFLTFFDRQTDCPILCNGQNEHFLITFSLFGYFLGVYSHFCHITTTSSSHHPPTITS